MIKDKRFLGVCIAQIHNNTQMEYLHLLQTYAQKQDYQLIIFNSFAGSEQSGSYHDDGGSIYAAIHFDSLDALILHTASITDASLLAALTRAATSHGVPILPEEICYSDVSSCMSELAVSSLIPEDAVYDWLAQVLGARDITGFYSLLSRGILPGSHVCLNQNFIDIMIQSSVTSEAIFSEDLIVIESSASATVTKFTMKLSDMVPAFDTLSAGCSTYLLSTIHVNKKVYGYYVSPLRNIGDILPYKRIVSALNLAFHMGSRQFFRTDTPFNITQAVLNNNDRRLPFNLLIEKNLFFYHFQPIVNAHDGSVFAYEALMRTDPLIGMTPLEVIDAASAYGRLYDIEKATMSNTLAYIGEHEELFSERKLFINSIPAYM